MRSFARRLGIALLGIPALAPVAWASDGISVAVDCADSHPDGADNVAGTPDDNWTCQVWGIAMCKAADARNHGVPEWDARVIVSQWAGNLLRNDRSGSRIPIDNKAIVRRLVAYVYQEPGSGSTGADEWKDYFTGTLLCDAQRRQLDPQQVSSRLERCSTFGSSNNYDDFRDCLYQHRQGTVRVGPLRRVPAAPPGTSDLPARATSSPVPAP